MPSARTQSQPLFGLQQPDVEKSVDNAYDVQDLV